MMDAQPYQHHIPIRVYYEDTDHGGVVYYANYLKFMERGRTELLRSFGLDLQHLAEHDGIMFAVTHADVHYHAPARFNDLLEVRSRISTLRGARIAFSQHICRQETDRTYTTLVSATIDLACINQQHQACRIPRQAINTLQTKDRNHD